MKRQHVHFVIDSAMAAAGLGLIATGLLLEFVLPAHSRQASVWGMTRHDWGELHFWLALAILGLLLVHLALNWSWVCTVVTKLCGKSVQGARGWRRPAMGIATLLLIVALLTTFLWAASASKEAGSRGGGWGHRHTMVE